MRCIVAGPLWVEEDDALYFTDTISATIYKLPGSAGSVAEPFLLDAGGFDGTNVCSYDTLAEPGSNGMALDAAGNAIICQHATARVVRTRLSAATPGSPFWKNKFDILADSPSPGQTPRTFTLVHTVLSLRCQSPPRTPTTAAKATPTPKLPASVRLLPLTFSTLHFPSSATSFNVTVSTLNPGSLV